MGSRLIDFSAGQAFQNLSLWKESINLLENAGAGILPAFKHVITENGGKAKITHRSLFAPKNVVKFNEKVYSTWEDLQSADIKNYSGCTAFKSEAFVFIQNLEKCGAIRIGAELL